MTARDKPEREKKKQNGMITALITTVMKCKY